MVGRRLAALICLVLLGQTIAVNVAISTSEQRSQDRPIETRQLVDLSSGDAAHPSAEHGFSDGIFNTDELLPLPPVDTNEHSLMATGGRKIAADLNGLAAAVEDKAAAVGSSEQEAVAVGGSSSGGVLAARTRTTSAVGDEEEDDANDPFRPGDAAEGGLADPNDAAAAAELEEAERTAEFIDPAWGVEDGEETLPRGDVEEDDEYDDAEDGSEEEIVLAHDGEEGWDFNEEDDPWAEEEEIDKRKQRLGLVRHEDDDGEETVGVKDAEGTAATVTESSGLRRHKVSSQRGGVPHDMTHEGAEGDIAEAAGKVPVDDDALLKEEKMRMKLKDSTVGTRAHFHTLRRVRPGETLKGEEEPQVAGVGDIDEVDFLLKETEMRSATDGTKAVLRARKQELPPETQVDTSLPEELQKETRMRSSLRSAVRKTPQQQHLPRSTRQGASPQVVEQKRAVAAGVGVIYEERIDFLLKETEMRSATDGTKVVFRTRPSEHPPQLTHEEAAGDKFDQQKKEALLKETAMRSAADSTKMTSQNSRKSEHPSEADVAQHAAVADDLLAELNKKYSGGGGAAGSTATQRQAAKPALQQRWSPSPAAAKAKPQPNPFNLPSFESTPVPNKPSLWQWQDEYQAARSADARTHAARLRGDDGVGPPLHPSISAPHAYEFTSREFLVLNRPQPGYVAACLVARDAHDDVGEWVHHHLKLGIGPIYVYDHASIPPMDSVLKHWINAGAVVYEKLATPERGERPQLVGYKKCLKDHGAQHRWLTFFDADEYLVFTDNGGYGVPPVQSLPVLLKRYEQYSALAVHWVLFGSSGRVVRPSRGALRSYVRCLPANHTHHLYVKTIANTRCTVAPSDTPHAFKHNCSRPAVRTNFAPVEGQTAADLPVYSKLALLHYATRSQEEFEVKMARGSGMKRQRGWEYFAFVDNWSVDFCLQGLRGWDDNIVTLPRTLDPGSLQQQLESYSKEEHEDFWGARAAANLAKAAAAQRAEEADRWGKDEDEDDEYEFEYDANKESEAEGRDEWQRRQQQRRRRKLIEDEEETSVEGMAVAASAEGYDPFLEAMPT